MSNPCAVIPATEKLPAGLVVVKRISSIDIDSSLPPSKCVVLPRAICPFTGDGPVAESRISFNVLDSCDMLCSMAAARTSGSAL